MGYWGIDPLKRMGWPRLMMPTRKRSANARVAVNTNNKPTTRMTKTTDTNNLDSEFSNEEFIYESMLNRGHSEVEASDILYNLYHYGSPGEAEARPTQPNEPIVFDDEFWKIARSFEEMIKEKSTDTSTI
jgi:hypothetical protein